MEGGEEESDDSQPETEDDDTEYRAEINRKTKEEILKKRRADEVIIGTADRFGMSNTAVAHIANAVRSAEDLITEKANDKVFYQSKVKRMRKKDKNK